MSLFCLESMTYDVRLTFGKSYSLTIHGLISSSVTARPAEAGFVLQYIASILVCDSVRSTDQVNDLR